MPHFNLQLRGRNSGADEESFYKTAAGRENKCLATDKLKLEFQPKPAGRVPDSKFLENPFDLFRQDVQ